MHVSVIFQGDEWKNQIVLCNCDVNVGRKSLHVNSRTLFFWFFARSEDSHETGQENG